MSKTIKEKDKSLYLMQIEQNHIKEYYSALQATRLHRKMYNYLEAKGIDTKKSHLPIYNSFRKTLMNLELGYKYTEQYQDIKITIVKTYRLDQYGK